MTTKPPAFIETKPSTEPGGYKPSPHLDRANTFGRIAFALEAAKTARTLVALAEVRKAAEAFGAEFENDKRDLLALAYQVETGARKLRDLENLLDARAEHYGHAQSSTLTTAPKHMDAFQIHATEQARKLEANPLGHLRAYR